MIEKGPSHVGVIFTPKLGDQRVEWALEVLRREKVGSVLDVGCGEGRLLEVLCRPAVGVMEDPIEPESGSSTSTSSSGQMTNGLQQQSTNVIGRLKRQRSETNTPMSNNHDHRPGHAPGSSVSTHGQSEEAGDSMMMLDPTEPHTRGMNGSGSTSTEGGSTSSRKNGVVRDLYIHVSVYPGPIDLDNEFEFSSGRESV